MLLDQVRNVLKTINDPEMPISIVDLGIVDDVAIESKTPDSALTTQDSVTIRILPTFVGCPALDMLRDEITQKIAGLPGVASVQVQFAFNPPWSPDRISPQGQAALKHFGVTLPHRHTPDSPPLIQLGLPDHPACPFCGADQTRLESPFGPTRCRMIYYCEKCKNQFEHMKRTPTT